MTENATLTKGEILAAIERERAAWEALLAEVGEDRMLEPGPMGDWTFKDLASHITGWRVHSLRRLEAAANGEPAPAPPWPAAMTTDDEINGWIHAQGQNQLLGEVLDESRESFARLAEVVQQLPDDALTDPTRFPGLAGLEGTALAAAIVNGDFFSHLHEEHEADIRRWLESAM